MERELDPVASGMVQFIASICHEVNRAYCQSIGDTSQPAWKDAPDWQKESAIKGVMHALANPDTTPGQTHECWLEEKRKDGWVHGPVKDVDMKVHPCFVPYDQLPQEHRVKDHLFLGVVRAMSSPFLQDSIKAVRA